MNETNSLRFYGGTAGALVPFAVFLGGVGWLAFSGAPDERGFWPILIVALAVGLLLARDRTAYSETLIVGMSQPIVMIMVMAWLLASVFGSVMNASGFIEGLVWTAGKAGVSGAGFVIASFLICCVVSTATGTSLGTVLLCAPLLYPAGGLLGAHPPALIGAILGGAVFGDNISPVSDTTIASATTQGADLGGVVRSRLKYALLAASLAIVGYAIVGGGDTGSRDSLAAAQSMAGDPRGLPMLLAPAAALGVLLRRRHLIEGLMAGIVTALVLGVALGLLAPSQIIGIDADNLIANGLILEGMERGLGVSILTILLMGLVAGVEATGVLELIVAFAGRRTHSAQGAEWWIFGTVTAVGFLIMHSAVAILAVGTFARQTGKEYGITRYRRANILDMTVCTFPFLVPFFIPVVLAASTTQAGEELGVPRVSLIETGLYNFHSWALLAVVIFAIVTGFGRDEADAQE